MLIFRSVLLTKTEVNRDVPTVTPIKLEQHPDHRVNPQLTDQLRVVLLRVILVPQTANQAVILQPWTVTAPRGWDRRPRAQARVKGHQVLTQWIDRQVALHPGPAEPRGLQSWALKKWPLEGEKLRRCKFSNHFNVTVLSFHKRASNDFYLMELR